MIKYNIIKIELSKREIQIILKVNQELIKLHIKFANIVSRNRALKLTIFS